MLLNKSSGWWENDRNQRKINPKKKKHELAKTENLTEKRKGASDRLFVLEIDSDLDESGDEPKKCALELLSVKVKK